MEPRYHRGRAVLGCTRHNITIPDDLWARLQERAAEEGMSASALLRKLAIEYMSDNQGQKKKYQV